MAGITFGSDGTPTQNSNQTESHAASDSGHVGMYVNAADSTVYVEVAISDTDLDVVVRGGREDGRVLLNGDTLVMQANTFQRVAVTNNGTSAHTVGIGHATTHTAHETIANQGERVFYFRD